jgi:3-phenylpropionate/trans-cinnamate dioxygenase ferredoxin subunit
MAFLVAGLISEMVVGQIKPIELNGNAFLLCRTGEGFFVIDNTCTHDGGPLAGGCLDGNEIECPRHGARFDLASGEVRCLPAAVGIRSYPVRLDQDKILVDVQEAP